MHVLFLFANFSPQILDFFGFMKNLFFSFPYYYMVIFPCSNQTNRFVFVAYLPKISSGLNFSVPYLLDPLLTVVKVFHLIDNNVFFIEKMDNFYKFVSNPF